MFGSAILDVLIGVVTAFLGVSLAASAITEAFNSALELRQKTLLSGIGRLLNDTKFTGLALTVLNHGLVNPLGSGDATSKAGLTANPAYVDATHFATGLIAAVQGANPTRPMQDSIDAIEDKQIREAMQALWRQAGENEDAFTRAIGTWFDSAMERVGGEFKRKAQFISFAAALLVAVALNVDGLHITQELWQRPVLAEGLPADPTLKSEAKEYLAALQDSSLIGWHGFAGTERDVTGEKWTLSGVTGMILGWLIVAGAALFGAPFWFDTLQRITQLRGVGGGPGIQSHPRA